MEQGTHVFDIIGYSTYKGMGNNSYISSDTFSVGDHDWPIRFYPDGCTSGYAGGAVQPFISVYLELMTKGAIVHVSCDLSLVDHTVRL